MMPRRRCGWRLLVVALAVARIMFVARWWPAYQASPWSILNIRDRGWNLPAGCVALVMAALVVMRQRPGLRRALPVAVAGGVAAATLTVLVASPLQSTSHPPLSATTLHDLDGSPTTLAALAGQPMVINLWATRCPPCRGEMPMLAGASRTTPGVRFVFVDQGEPAATVRAFLETLAPAPGHVLLDPDSMLGRDYRAMGYPTTLFVDGEGRLRDTQVGPLSRATLQEHLLNITPVPAKSTSIP